MNPFGVSAGINTARAPGFLLEVCIASLDDALDATAGGADRLELNSALELGGLTPSAGSLLAITGALDLPVIAMIRPRAGGFRYSPGEFKTMRADVDRALALGAKGIAIGLLDSDGRVDVGRMREIRSQLGDADLVFHRAFDFVPEPFAALEQLVDLGIDRILTSGQKPSALEGAALLGRLRRQAAGRIGLVAGGGVSVAVVDDLVKRSGCREYHGSFRWTKPDPTMGAGLSRELRSAFGSPAGLISGTDAAIVRAVRERLDATIVAVDGEG
jgi:copper homeostasis protein